MELEDEPDYEMTASPETRAKRKQQCYTDDAEEESKHSPPKLIKDDLDYQEMSDLHFKDENEQIAPVESVTLLPDIDIGRKTSPEPSPIIDSTLNTPTKVEYTHTPTDHRVNSLPVKLPEVDHEQNYTATAVGNDSRPYIEGNNSCDSDMSAAPYDANEQKAAEDIVRKLCKNGKLMEFQEGEDFIKVIVYEDSQEEDGAVQSDEDEEQVKGCSGLSKTLGGRAQSRNLLDCLTDTDKENQASTHVTESKRQPGSAEPTGFYHTPCDNHELPNMADSFPLLQAENKMYNHQQGHSRNAFGGFYPDSAHSAGMSSQSTAQQSGLHHRAPGMTPTSSRMKNGGGCSKIQLNSSGEEISPTLDPLGVPSSEQIHNRVRSLMHLPQFQVEDNGKIREQHNQKERRRRARIKEACNLLRQLVPGMSDKTDKATVFEFAARYVHFLKSHTGAQYDKDFLMKYSPY